MLKVEGEPACLMKKSLNPGLLFLGIQIAQILVLKGEYAIIAYKLKRYSYSRQATKGGTQNLMPGDNILQGSVQDRGVEHSLDQYEALGAIRLVLDGLLCEP